MFFRPQIYRDYLLEETRGIGGFCYLFISAFPPGWAWAALFATAALVLMVLPRRYWAALRLAVLMCSVAALAFLTASHRERVFQVHSISQRVAALESSTADPDKPNIQSKMPPQALLEYQHILRLEIGGVGYLPFCRPFLPYSQTPFEPLKFAYPFPRAPFETKGFSGAENLIIFEAPNH